MISPLRLFFLLALALTWGLGGLGLLIGLSQPGSPPLAPSSPLYYLAAYAVSLTGIGLTAAYSGRDGLRRMASRLIPDRSAFGWSVVVVAGYTALTAIALGLAAGPVAMPSWSAVLGRLVLSIATDPGPLGEEFGWRGFALPRMLERQSPVAASLRLGLIHTLWHLPLFFIPGMPQTRVSFVLFAVGVTSIAIFATSLHLRNGAGLLMAILVHILANVGGGLAAEAGTLHVFLAAEGIAALAIVAAGGLARRETADTLSSPDVARSR